MVITLHFVVKDLGFFGRGVGDQRVLNDGENVVANVDELRLDLELVVLHTMLTVAEESLKVGRVLAVEELTNEGSANPSRC